MNSLIIGGSSGLGLALAKECADAGDKVFVTGRTDPKVGFAEFKKLDLSADPANAVNELVVELPAIDRLIYAAGFWRQSPIADLTDEDIEQKLNLGAKGIIFIVRDLLKKQKRLKELIVITSMSQWRPSKQEPVYNFVKAGQANMLAGLSQDGVCEKILVVAPADMREGSEGSALDEKDSFLNKAWVAQQVIKQMGSDFNFKSIKILRQPARVEVADQR